MKKTLLVGLLTLLVGCGERTVTGTLNGTDGKDGKDGKDGTNGHSIVSQFSSIPVESLECRAGGNSLNLYVDMDDSYSASEGDIYTGSLVSCNGSNGLDGINGTDGQDGLDGENGQDGAPGMDGRPGRPGRNGRNGTNGRPGRDGQDGLPGAQGVPGEQGPAGPAGAQGVPGMVGPVGPVGPSGIQGEQGEQGPVGPTGSTGEQGPAGASGTQVTITVYPRTSSCVLISGSLYYTKSGDIYSNNTCSSSNKVAEMEGSGESFWVALRILATDNNNSGLRVITFN